MANEMTYSDLADQRVAALINRELLDLNFDPTALRSRLRFLPHSLNGSMAMKTPLVQRSYTMAAPGEDTAGSNSAFVDSSVTLTPARRLLQFYETDIAILSTPEGGLNPEGFARIMAGAVELDYTALACTAGATATTNVGGGATVDCTVDDLYDGVFALNIALANGLITGCFRPNSFNELVASLRGETGAIQYLPNVGAILNGIGGSGYKGTLLGVDIMSMDKVIEDTNVNQNFLFVPDAIVYTYGAVGKVLPYITPSMGVSSDAMSYITSKWDDTKAALTTILNHYPSVAVADQNKLVGILSDDV